ncbi:hypothetical protein N7495_009622 [Penicillium taxi]|uniref:uncharacterized protein n=1 Tax=Penicillium taxi TaxID=168475 RepID=UPI002545882C|nr:uncharacterized protein N7495_009622 [Penicillium taxi]KAJ5885112.1 hypothetical protein N7495_009622 [Penicillium taxi]
MHLPSLLAGISILGYVTAAPVLSELHERGPPGGYYDIPSSSDEECMQPYEPVDWKDPVSQRPWDVACANCITQCARRITGLQGFVLGVTVLTIPQYHQVNLCGVQCVGSESDKGPCYGGASIGNLRSQAAVITYWLKAGKNAQGKKLVPGVGASSQNETPASG